jgi:hypothetical protein
MKDMPSHEGNAGAAHSQPAGRQAGCVSRAAISGEGEVGVVEPGIDQHAREATNFYGTQSPIKMLVSCGALPLRLEAHTSFLPSGENMGKPSKPSL